MHVLTGLFGSIRGEAPNRRLYAVLDLGLRSWLASQSLEVSLRRGRVPDKFAIEAFCPQFADGFHILDTVTADGVFVLTDNAGVGAVAVDGPACAGAGGYSDIAPTTPVVVKNGKGDVLATSSLGPGKGDASLCTFSFTFPVTEGQDRYVVSVGRRGEFSYTFGQLRGQGVHIRLGR
jgi:hypothetical protein